jgi:2-C-methyl-D-erythritol 4-phosphate cytidylyltransferase
MQGKLGRRYLIVVAGGTGTRMQSAVPKQFMSIGGIPVLAHTLKRFSDWDPHLEIVVVMHQDWIEQWKVLSSQFCPDIMHSVVAGGKERFDSVKAGLALVKDSSAIVGIHDAVRPLVSADTLMRCFDTAQSKGSAIPCVPVTDSIRVIDDNGSRHMDRAMLRAVQTPQCFMYSVLLKAYEQDFKASFTDDASVVEEAGFQVHLVEGNRENIKITNPEDIAVAESLLLKL